MRTRTTVPLACLRSCVLVASLLLVVGCGTANSPDPSDVPGGSGANSTAGGAPNGALGMGGSSARAGANPAPSNVGGTGALGSAGATPSPAGAGAPGASAGAPNAQAGAAVQMGPATDVPDGPSAHALNPVTGQLNVDYASYLSHSDVVYKAPNTNPLYGLFVGTGRMGGIAWSEGGLKMQVSNVDTSPQTAYSGGNVQFDTMPALDAGADGFEQRLSLYDGTLTTTYGAGRRVTLLGAPRAEVLGIHVEDDRADAQSATLDLSLWDVSTLGNFANVRDLDTWKTVSTFAETDSAGFSRGQTDPDNFGYTLAATVEGAEFSTAASGGQSVRLTISPSASYTIWVALATRLNAPAHDSVTEAKRLLTETKTNGYAATHQAFTDFWHGFWKRSFVQYSNAAGDADYFESVYYLATYMIAMGAFGNYPAHFINGVIRATADETKWSNAYWYWNQRDVYYSFYASNHLDMMQTFNEGFSRNFDALKAETQSRYGIDGIWLPETYGWNGNSSGTVNSEYTNKVYSSAAEASYSMYEQYLYGGDEDYLANAAYPFMREAAKFYAGILSLDAASGQYYMADSNSHETHWDVENAFVDLVAIRTLFPIVIDVSTQLGVDAELRAEWQDVLTNLVDYDVQNGRYLEHEPPITQTRNNENVSCEIIWPYGLTGIDAPDFDTALTTWNTRPFPYGNVWANDAIQAARLGLGEETFEGLRAMLQRYQNYPNGMTANTNGVFEYLGVHLIAMNESLLQSYDGRIRVFPALPDDASFVGRFTLLATGGFLVSSEKEQGSVKYVGVKSLLGNAATVINPWQEEVTVRTVPGDAVVLTGADPQIQFDTEAGTLYVLEPSARPLSGYTYGFIGAEPNAGAKELLGTPSTLGIGMGVTGRYEAESAELNLASASGDGGASGGVQVTGLSPAASVTFRNVQAGTTLTVRYCTMNDPAQLSLYVNGTHVQDVVFPSTGSWGGTYDTVTANVTIPEGATLTFQVDDGDSGANLDFIQVE